MATATEKPTAENQHQYVDFDEYVGFHLSRTQSGIKSSEILTRLGWIATLGLSYLLLFTVADHWMLEGGLGRATRIGLLLCTLVLGVGWFVWRVALPYFRRINALYAAREIEHAAPGLKGGLLNLIDLQHAQKKIPDHVRVAIEKHAAVQLSNIDVDQAVDRRPLMRVSYLLLAVVTICCLYALFSPKDILTSVKRALLPTSETPPPTQTRITEVDPGNRSVVELSTVSVTAKIGGREPETVTLYYSTGDRKYVDEPVPMQRESDGLPTFTALLAGENGRGLLEDVSYRIEAGDAVTENYTITVVKPPSARVISTSYAFPPYMELEDHSEPTGHINAYEGTEVTIRAETNIPVKSARIVFVQDDRATGEEVRMQVNDGDQLTASWKLEIREDGTFAPHYWIQCQTEDDQKDPNPTRYNIVIKPDLPPEIALLAPQHDLKMPANGTVPLRYKAADPDFRLRSLRLIVTKDGSVIVSQPLVEDERLSQQAEGVYDWRLEPLKLTPGEHLKFFLQVKDNRLPRANTKQTPVLNLEIIEPVSEKEAQEQLQEEKKRQQEQLDEQSQEPEAGEAEQREQQEQPQEKQQDQPQEGEKQEGEQAESGEAGEPGEDGEQGGAASENTKPGEKGEAANEDDAQGENSGQTGKEPGSDEQGSAGTQQRPLDPENPEDQEQALKEILKHQREQQEQNQQQDLQQQNESQEQNPGEQPQDDSSATGDDQSAGSGEQNDQQNKDQPSQGGQSTKDNPAEGSPQTPGEPGGESSPTQAPGTDKQTPNQETPGEKGEQPQPSQDAGEQGKQPQPKTDSQNPGEQDENVTGKEKPAADDPQAVKKDATGEETGPAKAADQQEAEKAKNKLDREGEKNEAGRKPGDPQAKPQETEKGNPDDPEKSQAQPKPGDPQEHQPQGPEGEQQPKPRDDSQTRPEEKPENSGDPPQGEGRKDQKSQEPQEGEQGGSSKSEEGEKGSQQPGGGDDSSKPGDKTEGEPDSKSGGKPGEEKAEGKPGEGQEAQPNAGQPADDGSSEGSPSEGEPSGGGNKSEGSPDSQSKSPSTESKGELGSPEGQATSSTGGGAAPPSDQGPTAPGGEGEADQAADGQPKGENNQQTDPTSEPERANLEYKKKATELVLDKLNDQLERGEVDEDLKQKLGWTDEQIRKFTEKLQEQLRQTDNQTTDDPASIAERRQFEEMLKDLQITPQTQKRASSAKNQQRVRQLDKGRTPPPQQYRRIYQEFTRSLSKTVQEQPPTAGTSTEKR